MKKYAATLILGISLSTSGFSADWYIEAHVASISCSYKPTSFWGQIPHCQVLFTTPQTLPAASQSGCGVNASGQIAGVTIPMSVDGPQMIVASHQLGLAKDALKDGNKIGVIGQSSNCADYPENNGSKGLFRAMSIKLYK